MTRILAIETSTELATAALLTDERILIRELNGVQTHSQGILPAIQSLLMEAGIRLRDCDAIAFGCGPGAFTGIRTACGIVQGLAYGADLAVLPVVSLLAMAQAAREQSQAEQFVCILDARMNEVYWAQYRFDDAGWVEVSAPALNSLDQALAGITLESAQLVLGNGLNLPESAGTKFASMNCMPHAKQILSLATLDFAAGRSVPADQAQPLYLRNKIALTTAEREQVKAQTAERV
ncbi:tRNA (adenosine(37)-N6)-threonylcarbamoyltransferase complex dimerization subunit type 1 TsaB [Undibacterium sp. TS12]|uniref:tRNA (adenosine(37)-N6)-threonylcarbamoyltransferase complex dimerization subunit type 1 TsaB n=1 Tax=Undibacterium sp. TS12 TaxID=2908202 RepID=UPI001F4CD9E1|nr:tRNA (adenosine(37)-N6)-threonylcarbamoyltransferase complex dimerization subunit type 1 TsaB [Undibacterium sp. TS12]MCH8619092.1 tRNA (adenosine(37)-N6)-threonylcarbamoyltransferase complex dimerization subunit type 1 TsaB [Undibacterium sp. TS12]